MIHSFTCKNFYSFEDETTVSFVVNDNAPNDNGYFAATSGTRLSKIETVIGPNASGKTNLLKVLPFFKWLITSKPGNFVPVRPFEFGNSKNKPTDLSVTFEIDKKVYTHKFTLTKDRILSEELKVAGFIKKKKSTKKIFSREWNNTENRYEFDGENFDLPKGFEKLLPTSVSVIGLTGHLTHKASQPFAKYWKQIETNVVEVGHVGDHLSPNSGFQLSAAFDFFSKNSVLKTEADKLLRRFDLGLNGFEIGKEKKGNGFSLNVRGKHLFNGQEQYLPVQYESSGTKQLFVILRSILVALEKGSIAIIDEFDVNLHPEMVMALHDLFVQPETNPKNAQLLMSTHSHILLSRLDKYQIVLVEKNENGVSEAWRLDEMSNVRSDENYYSKYLAGAYGAVPNI